MNIEHTKSNAGVADQSPLGTKSYSRRSERLRILILLGNHKCFLFRIGNVRTWSNLSIQPCRGNGAIKYELSKNN
jgi:hypothetical protein